MNFFIGKIFWTTKTTLQSEPDSMLAKMFSGEFAPGTKDEQGAYLLDQNPKYFEPILDYLRTRELINDPNVSMDGVLAVARFFGIQSLVDQIEELKQAEEKFEKEKKAKAESAERIEKQKNEEGLATLKKISNDLSKMVSACGSNTLYDNGPQLPSISSSLNSISKSLNSKSCNYNSYTSHSIGDSLEKIARK